jgi:HlyD family secretion protein
MKKRAVSFLVALLTACGVAYAGWRFGFGSGGREELVLHGNVDLRQVDLPFNAQQRVAAVLVEEGDRVSPGQVVARLETDRLQAAADEAAARVAAQQRIVEKLDNGTRPEEVAQARANLAAAEAEMANARRHFERKKKLDGTGASNTEEIDDARAAVETAEAVRDARKHALDLALAGPRAEERAEARATLAALEATLALRKRELADAELRSPVTGVVRNRVLEPGEMASPGTTAVTLAVTDPKWVRAYVNETDLGKVRPGTVAQVEVDAYPARQFEGWVGFVSPVAEFTPKNVETKELRTSLVYEVRVFFRDPKDALRLGMPATVRLMPDRPAVPATQPASRPALAPSPGTPGEG